MHMQIDPIFLRTHVPSGEGIEFIHIEIPMVDGHHQFFAQIIYALNGIIQKDRLRVDLGEAICLDLGSLPNLTTPQIDFIKKAIPGIITYLAQRQEDEKKRVQEIVSLTKELLDHEGDIERIKSRLKELYNPSVLGKFDR